MKEQRRGRTLLPPLALAALLTLAVGLALLGLPAGGQAAELQVSQAYLEPCPAEDIGSQPDLRRGAGASCWALGPPGGWLFALQGPTLAPGL